MPTYEVRKEGIYRARYEGCREKLFEDPKTGEKELRLIWTFQDVKDASPNGTIDKITGTSMKSPNSNAHKIARGLFGGTMLPGVDTETNVGKEYDVWWGPNQEGNLTIVNVVAVGDTSVGPATSPAPAVPDPTTDQLPF